MRTWSWRLSLALAAVYGATAQGALSDDELRVGLLTDLTGIYSDWGGQGMVIAAEMAIEDQGREVAGRPIRLLVRDDRLDADVALAAARELHQDEHVDALVGFVATNVALPVQAYAREQGLVTLVSGAASADLTGRACSPTGVHWTYDTYALAQGSVSGLMEEQPRSWFFVTADYAFGHLLEAQTREAVLRHGGEVKGGVRAPYGGRMFVKELMAARDSGAELVALASAGEDTQRTIRQAYEMEIPQRGQQVVGLLMFLTDIRRLGLYVTQGLRFTTGFYWNRDAATRAWAERFQARHGAMPTMAQAGLYSGLRHYFKAVEAAGSDTGIEAVKAMKRLPVSDFFAPHGRVRADGRMVHDMYLVEVKRPSESELTWDYLKIIKTIPGDQAFRPLDAGGCPYLQ